MEYEVMIQSVLDIIDSRIKENIKVNELAHEVKYSMYHFCCIFMALTETSVMNYVTRRTLEYAIYDLSQGNRIIDVAINYGFQTHVVFTKIFKKHFKYPSSLHQLHTTTKLLKR